MSGVQKSDFEWGAKVRFCFVYAYQNIYLEFVGNKGDEASTVSGQKGAEAM